MFRSIFSYRLLLLSNRTEILAKCRHKRKFLIWAFKCDYNVSGGILVVWIYLCEFCCVNYFVKEQIGILAKIMYFYLGFCLFDSRHWRSLYENIDRNMCLTSPWKSCFICIIKLSVIRLSTVCRRQHTEISIVIIFMVSSHAWDSSGRASRSLAPVSQTPATMPKKRNYIHEYLTF